MVSINRQSVKSRISDVTDDFHAAQADGKSVNNHIKELRQAVKIKDTSAGNINDFLRDVGSV